MKAAWLYQRTAWTLLAFALTFQAGAQSFANRELRSMVSADKCVTAPANASDNAQLLLQPCNGSANQRFTLHPDGHLQAGVKNPQGYDLCVDYYPTQGAEGSPVRLFRCRPFGGAVDSHRWGWDNGSLRGAHGTFIAPLGGESAASAGSPALVMSTASGRAQQWTFAAPAAARAPEPAPAAVRAPEPAPAAARAPEPAPAAVRAPEPALASAPGTSLKLYSTHARGKCIAPAAGGGLVIWDCVENPNQRFEALPGGYLRQGGKCLASSADTVRFEECTRNATHQQWSYDRGMLRNRNVPAQCLDIERGATDNGTRILAFNCHGGANQLWSTNPQAVAVVVPAPVAPSPTQPGVRPNPPATVVPIVPPDKPSIPTMGQIPIASMTQERLDPIVGLQATAQASVQLVNNLQVLVDSMQANSTGTDALFDPEVATAAVAGLKFVRHLLETSPYSLQKIAQGSVVALNQEERDLLNQMLAQENLALPFYEANARLKQALWNIDTRIVRTETPYLMRSYAQMGGVGLSRLRDIRERVNLTGLGRAELLATNLNAARTLNSTRIFLEYSTLVESTVSALVENLVDRRRGHLPTLGEHTPEEYKAAHGKLTKVLKAYSLAKLAVQLSAATINAMVAVMPTSISGFYMTVNEKRYQRGTPAHLMKTGESAIARIYVIPQSPGGSVVTPLGAISLVIDAGFGPGVAKILSQGPAGTQIAQVYKDMFTQMVKLAGKYHVDTALSIVGNTKLGSWAKAFQEKIQIPAFNNTPVEINDVRVVKLTPGPVGAEHIRLGATPDRRFTVNAVSRGTTGITGDILLDDLYSGGGEKFLRIAIEVTDSQPSPPSGTRPPSAGPKRCGPSHANAFCEGNVCMDRDFGQPWPDNSNACK